MQQNPLFPIDETEIHRLSQLVDQKKSCESDSDALKSDVAQRILGTIVRHLDGRLGGEETADSDLIQEIYAAWSERKPITQEDKEELLGFLIQKETLSMLEQILGRLTFPPRNFPVWVPYDTTLLQSLSENETETAAREAISTLIASIRNYPLVIRHPLAEWTQFHEYPTFDGAGNLFSFMDEDGKHRLFFVDDGEKISHFERHFNNRPLYLGNWIVAASETERMGGLYHLTEAQNPDQSPKLDSAYIVNTFDSAEWFDENKGVLRIILSSGKSTLVQVPTLSAESVRKIRVRDLLPRYYDAIYSGPHDLVILEHTDKTDWTAEISAHLLSVLISWDMRMVESTPLFNHTEDVRANTPWLKFVQFYEGRNICRIWGAHGQSYYTYDPATKRFKPIGNLNNTSILKDHFFDGNPELIRRTPLNLTLSRFDALKNEVTDLAHIPDDMTPWVEMIGDAILLHNELLTIALWCHDNMVYRLNDDYAVIGEYVYERGWLLRAWLKRTDISLRQPSDRWSHLFEPVGIQYDIPKNKKGA